MEKIFAVFRRNGDHLRIEATSTDENPKDAILGCIKDKTISGKPEDFIAIPGVHIIGVDGDGKEHKIFAFTNAHVI